MLSELITWATQVTGASADALLAFGLLDGSFWFFAVACTVGDFLDCPEDEQYTRRFLAATFLGWLIVPSLPFVALVMVARLVLKAAWTAGGAQLAEGLQRRLSVRAGPAKPEQGQLSAPSAASGALSAPQSHNEQ